VREARMGPREGPAWRLRDVIVGPVSDGAFRGYLLYAFSESLMFGIAGPFFWLMGLEVLKIGNFWSNFYVMMVPMVFTALALPVWGNVCQEFGSKPLVTLGTLVSIVFPLCWGLATPTHHHALLAFASVVGGAFGAAIQVADMNMLFSLTPRQNRSAYIAVLSVAASLGWVIGPSIGGAIAQALRAMELHLAGRTVVNLHFLMALSVVARLAHVLLVVPRLPEDSKHTAGSLVRHLAYWPLQRIGSFWSRG